VLVKPKCKELLPNYLRFVKGVIDCEDLPLNVSREGHQDTQLMLRLKDILTKRVLRLLKDESKKDPKRFNQWFDEFGHFIKEGVATDKAMAD